MTAIRVVVIDDSPGARTALRALLEQDPGIEVVGVAGDPAAARAAIGALGPDVVTLDLGLPPPGGIRLLEELQRRRVRSVVVSGQATASDTVIAYRLGAAAVVAKPAAGAPIEQFGRALREAVRASVPGDARPRPAREATPPALGRPRPHGTTVLALGASTGGPAAIRAALAGLTRVPPTIVALHMSPAVAAPFAASLDELGTLAAGVARDGDLVEPGRVLVAPGGCDVEVCGRLPHLRVALRPPSGSSTPSVDRLFFSLAARAGDAAVAAVLSGMGRDGAEGLRALRAAGAGTVVQDPRTAAAGGMPRAALELGAADRVAELEELSAALDELIAAREAASGS